MHFILTTVVIARITIVFVDFRDSIELVRVEIREKRASFSCDDKEETFVGGFMLLGVCGVLLKGRGTCNEQFNSLHTPNLHNNVISAICD